MLSQLLMLIIGLISGYMVHAVGIRISFKQRTIDNKIKVYDAIIAHWVRMRNFIYHILLSKDPKAYLEFDKMYGDSQTFIGESVLVSENIGLVEDINAFNERMYRTDWVNLNVEEINKEMEDIKRVGLEIIKRMRKDIKDSTVLNLGDFLPILSRSRK